MKFVVKCVLYTLICFLVPFLACGQISSGELSGGELNTLHSAVSFLTISPDSRAGGLGDQGIATEPDVYSQHWNIAKYPFIDKKGGGAISYFSWLSNLVPGIRYYYTSGYWKINEKNVVSSSMRIFSLGRIVFISPYGTRSANDYNPLELAVDAGYSRMFTGHFSGGVTLRYIHSDLTSGHTTSTGDPTRPGRSVAADLGLYYQNDLDLGSMTVRWAAGTGISNMGSPVSYTRDAKKTPIPTNLGLGGKFGMQRGDHSVSVVVEANKLLVPTPPVLEQDTATGDLMVVRGKAPPESVIMGMIQSFYDAPGALTADGTYNTFLEEIHEIRYCIGIAYDLKNQFTLRSGYFHEHATKGNRKYLTAGVAVRNSFAALDVSLLWPVNGQNSPLAGTFRVSLAIEFDAEP